MRSPATKYDPENDLKRKFIHRDPTMQDKITISPSSVAGNLELAWRRGQHTGIHDAYKAIRRKYPEAAAYLISRFGMSPKGTLGSIDNAR